jgi:hypothetical protein
VLLEHGLGGFAKCWTHTLPGQVVSDGFSQQARKGPPFLVRVLNLTISAMIMQLTPRS